MLLTTHMQQAQAIQPLPEAPLEKTTSHDGPTVHFELIYSPGCPHSRAFISNWNAAVEQQTTGQYAAVNGQTKGLLQSVRYANHVKGFPSIVAFTGTDDVVVDTHGGNVPTEAVTAFFTKALLAVQTS